MGEHQRKRVRTVSGLVDEVDVETFDGRAELGQRDKARYYAQELIRVAPGNRNYAELYRSLSQP